MLTVYIAGSLLTAVATGSFLFLFLSDRLDPAAGRHRADGVNTRPLYRVPPGFRLAVRERASIGWHDWQPPFTPAGGMA